jgi:hypothetical protein
MMDDQKILDNVPPKQGKWPDCNQVDSDGKWSHRQPVIRSLADIKELVELRNEKAELDKVLLETPNTHCDEWSDYVCTFCSANDSIHEKDCVYLLAINLKEKALKAGN